MSMLQLHLSIPSVFSNIQRRICIGPRVNTSSSRNWVFVLTPLRPNCTVSPYVNVTPIICRLTGGPAHVYFLLESEPSYQCSNISRFMGENIDILFVRFPTCTSFILGQSKASINIGIIQKCCPIISRLWFSCSQRWHCFKLWNSLFMQHTTSTHGDPPGEPHEPTPREHLSALIATEVTELNSSLSFLTLSCSPAQIL